MPAAPRKTDFGFGRRVLSGMRSEQSMMRNDSTGVRLKRQVSHNCGILGRVVARLSLCAALLLVLDALIGASYDPCFAAQRRSALLIGNAAYQREPLPNAVNDV